MGPDLTQPKHTFDPQQIKARPIFDMTQRDFFWPKREKLKNLVISLRGNYPNPEVADPDLSNDPIWVKKI